mgnify:FL=1
MSGENKLLVMRHSKSSWKTNEPDHRRPLSGRGTRDAVVAGQFLAVHAPDLVWVSSATRAVQTWQCAQLGGASAAHAVTSDCLYAASADTMLGVLARTPESASVVVLIAHEPGVSDLVTKLAAPSALTDEVAAHFPTSAIAVLSHDQDWSNLTPGRCTLDSVEIPRG